MGGKKKKEKIININFIKQDKINKDNLDNEDNNENKQSDNNINSSDTMDNAENTEALENTDLTESDEPINNQENSEKLEKTKKRKFRKISLKTKKITGIIIRSLIVILAVILVIVIYLNRNNLSAENISEWFNEIIFGQGSGDGYPMTISGSTVYDISPANNDIALITDTSVMICNKYGKQYVNRQHGLGNPFMVAGDNRILVYDQGGTSLHTENRNDIIFELETENKIITADMNEKGVLAYATRSNGGYMSEMHVYNANNNEIYKGYSSKYLISDISISSDSKGVAALMLGAKDGGYLSAINIYNFKSDEPIQAEFAEDLFLKLNWSQFGITAVGTDSTVAISTEGEEEGRYDYNGYHLIKYAFGKDNQTVLFLSGVDGNTNNGKIVVLDENCNVIIELDSQTDVRDIFLAKERLYVLYSSNLKCYDFDNQEIGQWDIPENAETFTINGNTAYVFAMDSITTIDLIKQDNNVSQ